MSAHLGVLVLSISMVLFHSLLPNIYVVKKVANLTLYWRVKYTSYVIWGHEEK